MNRFQLTQFLALFLLLLGCSDRPQVTDPIQAERLRLPELSQEPLPPAVALTADYFQKSYPHLSQDEFQRKWRAAQKSGLYFLRSFANTWYDELAQVSQRGPIGPCFGDPHPENFGFLLFQEGYAYVFNDIDDSGACPVIFDALRYFTSLRLVLQNRELEAELRRAYIAFLNGQPLPQAYSQNVRPNPAKVRQDLFASTVIKGRIKARNAQPALAEGQTLLALLTDCTQCKLRDAVKLQTSGGGSAGLDRYWLLVENASAELDLYEFKELTAPASQRGPWSQQKTLSRPEMIEALWGKERPRFLAMVTHEQKPFLVRSRLAVDLPMDELKPEAQKNILMEQVYLLAQLHRKTLSGTTLLEEWLGRASEFQARRYGEALLAARGG